MQSSGDNLFTIEQIKKYSNHDYVFAKYIGDVPMYRRVMTDAELYRAGMFDWVGIISQLWDAIGKPIDEKRLNVYCKQLSDVPLGLLEAGINYAIRNNTYQTVPPIGQVWAGIRNELKPLNLQPGLDIKDAIEEWEKTLERRAVYVLAG